MKVAVLLLAAGRGSRFGGERPKQYALLRGRPLVAHALEHLAADERIRWIQPVLAAGDSWFDQIMTMVQIAPEILPPVIGGADRAESMRNGLMALPSAAEWVAVHDAARPVPSPALISHVLDAALEHGAAVPGLALHDTIKRIDARNNVLATLPREQLVAVQTPQVARRVWFVDALDRAGTLEEYSDDASLLEQAGYPVHVSQGEAINRKVTTVDDLRWLEAQLGT
ncbi:MAG: 2-C-methyl-D-erythritol 4-phosphate cytidylyltransferase [Zetaproteobacteria bacterium]|nr:MAG: 2-C-methyl-D-erythritol 4-phosphate cytidylyltransferase [Zetaproteobacteria bacterium]